MISPTCGPARHSVRAVVQTREATCRGRVSLDKPVLQTYEFFVVIDSIREFNHAVPFVPYEIHTVSGETYEVPHPDFISISPRDSFVVVIDSKDRPHHLNALLIERASLVNSHRRRKTPNK